MDEEEKVTQVQVQVQLHGDEQVLEKEKEKDVDHEKGKENDEKGDEKAQKIKSQRKLFFQKHPSRQIFCISYREAIFIIGDIFESAKELLGNKT